MEERITELEIKLSLAEDLLDDLNRTVFRQQEQIDLLQGQIRELHRQLLAVSSGDAERKDLRDEIPPHY